MWLICVFLLNGHVKAIVHKTTKYRANAVMNNGGMIVRSNYGVIFNHVGQIINGESFYRYTYAIDLSSYEDVYTQLSKMPCETQQQKSLNCEVFNAEIQSLNKLTTSQLTELATNLELALSLVPTASGFHTSSRRKRNVLSGIGDFMSDLFGLPTKSDFSVLQNHMREIGQLVTKDKNQLITSNEALSAFQLNTANAMNKALEAVTENRQKMVTLVSEFNVNEAHHEQVEAELNKDVRTLNLYVGMLLKWNTHVDSYRAGLAYTELQLQYFTDAIRKLTTGYLPEYLVPVDQIKAIFDHITNHLNTAYAGEFELAHDNPAFMYMMRNLVYTRTSRRLTIMLKIPIQNVGGILNVYRLDRFPVYIGDSDKSTLMLDLPEYFATTHDDQYYTEFDTAYYTSCRGTGLKTCQTERGLQRKDADIVSCAANLYKDDGKNIMKTCNIGYERTKRVLPNAVMLQNGTLVIHSAQNDVWTLNCPNADSVERSIKSCNFCLLDIPCRCSLSTKGFYVPHRLSNCVIPTDPRYPSVTYRNPVHLPTLQSTFSENAVGLINGEEVRINSDWGIDYPNISIIETDRSDVVASEKMWDSDFNKTMQNYNNKIKMYATAADKTIHTFMNWHDLTMSHVTDIKHKLGHWKSFLNGDNILGTVSVSFILNVVAICLGFFVIWKYR